MPPISRSIVCNWLLLLLIFFFLLLTYPPGHVFLGHAISTSHVTSLPHCHLFCVEHPKCLSYNFQYASASPTHQCEINYATGKMCPHNITRKEGFKYYEDTVSESVWLAKEYEVIFSCYAVLRTIFIILWWLSVDCQSDLDFNCDENVNFWGLCFCSPQLFKTEGH